MPWTPDVDRAAGPLYLALADAIARDVGTGRLPPGTRLPPPRALAQRRGVDVPTVSRAYAEAARRALVVGQVGRGTYVRSAPAPSTARLEPPTGLVDLSLNVPPEPCDPCESALRRALADLARDSAATALLAYAPLGGLPAHREAGAAWCAARGVAAGADRVLVCGGGQQGLTAVLSAHCEPGDTVLAESLTYPGFLAAARLLRLHVVGVAMDGDGIDPDALAHACRTVSPRPRLLLTIPTFQNPTGATMTAARRRRIVAVAREHDLTLVEDDVYGPLREGDATRIPPPPLAALAPERTYHVTSLSKAVTPALRTAWVAAPDAAAAERLIGHLQATGWMAAPLLGEVAARWIAAGTAEALVAERRREAAARRAIAERTLASN